MNATAGTGQLETVRGRCQSLSLLGRCWIAEARTICLLPCFPMHSKCDIPTYWLNKPSNISHSFHTWTWSCEVRSLQFVRAVINRTHSFGYGDVYTSDVFSPFRSLNWMERGGGGSGDVCTPHKPNKNHDFDKSTEMENAVERKRMKERNSDKFMFSINLWIFNKNNELM